jgi:hypothetical protein
MPWMKILQFTILPIWIALILFDAWKRRREIWGGSWEHRIMEIVAHLLILGLLIYMLTWPAE